MSRCTSPSIDCQETTGPRSLESLARHGAGEGRGRGWLYVSRGCCVGGGDGCMCSVGVARRSLNAT